MSTRLPTAPLGRAWSGFSEASNTFAPQETPESIETVIDRPQGTILADATRSHKENSFVKNQFYFEIRNVP